MDYNKLKKYAAGALATSAVFVASFAAAKCDPCPHHVYYTCSAACGGNLEDWWQDTCCGGGPYVAQSDQGEIWQECDAGVGANYCDQSCLPLDPNLPKKPNDSEDPGSPGAASNHTTECKHVGDSCTANGDCCSLMCASKTCQNLDYKPIVCKSINYDCKSNSDCCSTICTLGKCTYSDGSDKPGPSNGSLANVMQPSVLNWTINSYPNLGGEGSMTVEPYGVNSFGIQIDNPDDQMFEPQKVPNSTYDQKNKIFSKCLDHDYFNTRSDGKICFLNSAKTVTYRVKACAHKDCTDCGPYVTWRMTTGQAPELAGFTDNNNTSATADPDWNGPQALGNSGTSSFNLVTTALNWCAATIPPAYESLNQGQKNALSYQVMLYSDEQQVINLAKSYVPSKFTNYADWLKIDKLGFGPQKTCTYLEKQPDGTCKAEVVNPTSGLTPRLYFSNSLNPENDRQLVTKNVTYDWQVRPCYNNSNAGPNSCQSTSIQNYGQQWKLQTAQTPLAAPQAATPPDDQQNTDPAAAIPVGMPPTLSWKQPSGANSYEYQIQVYDGTKYQDMLKTPQRTINRQVLLTLASAETTDTDLMPVNLTLDTAYRWRVRSCWPSLPLQTTDCNEQWSAWFGFRTTGRPPKTGSMQPPDNSTEVALPVTFQWEHVPGALSYVLTVNNKAVPVTKFSGTDTVSYQLTYPDVTQKQTYHWNVETCANADATDCGMPGDTLTLNTAALGTPANGLPTDQETLHSADLPLAPSFSWDPVGGAQYYHFVMTYADKSSEEKNSDCTTGEKVNTFVENKNTTTVDNAPQGVYCLGTYKWNVQACMDPECKDSGPVSPDWTFTLVAGEAAKKGSGIMVCGQADDNPNTPYDEREQCGPKHFFMELERIINFVLFELAFWLLPILGAATGVIFYKSLGGPEIWDTVKSWWKAIGIGYALLFSAWVIVGILLRIFGYTSLWWKI